MVKKHLRSLPATRFMLRPKHSIPSSRQQLQSTNTKKRRGRSPAAVMDRMVRRNQRRSWRTLWFDWLASASAETAIDWRVDSAWLLAAYSLESARVRLDDPVCSTLIRFFEKS